MSNGQLIIPKCLHVGSHVLKSTVMGFLQIWSSLRDRAYSCPSAGLTSSLIVSKPKSGMQHHGKPADPSELRSTMTYSAACCLCVRELWAFALISLHAYKANTLAIMERRNCVSRSSQRHGGLSSGNSRALAQRHAN